MLTVKNHKSAVPTPPIPKLRKGMIKVQLFKIGWKDSTGQPSRFHLTDSEQKKTYCGYFTCFNIVRVPYRGPIKTVWFDAEISLCTRQRSCAMVI